MENICLIYFKKNGGDDTFYKIISKLPIKNGFMYLFLPEFNVSCYQISEIVKDKFNLIHFCEITNWDYVDTIVRRICKTLTDMQVFIHVPDWLPRNVKKQLLSLSEEYNYKVVV